MKKDWGAKLMAYPTPLYLVATYDAQGNPNAMTVGWGGICCSVPPCVSISVRKATHTYEGLMAHRAFSVNLPDETHMQEASYLGTSSGKNEDKFARAGLTPVRCTCVDAPYIEQMPINLECKVVQIHEIGSHIQFIGEIVNVKTDDTFTAQGVPLIEQLRPIVYGVGDNHRYYKLGEGVSIKIKA